MNLLLVVDESTQLIYASRSLPQTHPVQEKVQHEWLLHFLPLLATQHVLQQELDGEQLRHVQSEDGSRLFLYSVCLSLIYFMLSYLSTSLYRHNLISHIPSCL